MSEWGRRWEQLGGESYKDIFMQVKINTVNPLKSNFGKTSQKPFPANYSPVMNRIVNVIRIIYYSSGIINEQNNSLFPHPCSLQALASTLGHQEERLRKNRETMHTELGKEEKEALILGEKFTYPTAFCNCGTDMNYHLSYVYFTTLCKTYSFCYCREIQNYGKGL